MAESSFNQLLATQFADLQRQLIAEHAKEVDVLKEEVSSLRAEIARLRSADASQAVPQKEPEPSVEASKAAAASANPASVTSSASASQPTRRQRGGAFSAQTKAEVTRAPVPPKAQQAETVLEPFPPPIRRPAERVKPDTAAAGNAEEKDQPWEAEHGFAGRLFGAALLENGSMGETEVNDILVALGKTAPPPPPPNAAYSVGQQCEVIGTIMRKSESMESPKLVRLEPGTTVEIMEIGSGSTGKRVRVLSQTGMMGWISVVSSDGQQLLKPLGDAAGGDGLVGDLIGMLHMEEEGAPPTAQAASVESATGGAEKDEAASSAKPKRQSAFNRYTK